MCTPLYSEDLHKSGVLERHLGPSAASPGRYCTDHCLVQLTCIENWHHNRRGVDHETLFVTAILIGGSIAMTQAAAAAPDPATDPQIDPKIRSFLSELNKDSSPFWEKPGPQVRAVLTGLQAKTPVNLSGITISKKTVSENGQRVKLYIMKPDKVDGTPPVLFFIHGGVWIAGDFENHKRLVRDLVVGSGAAA